MLTNIRQAGNVPIYPLRDGVWQGQINIRAPNGWNVPVHHSEKPETITGSGDWGVSETYYDPRDEVSTIEYPAWGTENYTAFRALPGIDYSAWGFIKIGKVWVDPQSQRDVHVATVRYWQEQQAPPLCTIL